MGHRDSWRHRVRAIYVPNVIELSASDKRRTERRCFTGAVFRDSHLMLATESQGSTLVPAANRVSKRNEQASFLSDNPPPCAGSESMSHHLEPDALIGR